MHFITMPFYHAFYISRLYIAEVLFIDIYQYQWHHSLRWLSPYMWALTLSHTDFSLWRWRKHRFHTLTQFYHWASTFGWLSKAPFLTDLLFFWHITVDSSRYSLLLNFSLSNLLSFFFQAYLWLFFITQNFVMLMVWYLEARLLQTLKQSP